jgi:hypothetical protein
MYVPPETLFVSIEEGTASTEKPTVRQAVILEQLGITECTPDELWSAVKSIPKRCYGHEQGPLLAEVLHRYPEILDVIDLSFIDGRSVLVSRKDGNEQHTVSLDVTPLTEPMVYEAMDQAPRSIDLRTQEVLCPTGELHSSVKFNPHSNKVVDDLVFKHDRDHVLSMLEKPKHVRVRLLESILKRDSFARGPYEVTDVGKFCYLLYKKVEIVSLWVGDKPPIAKRSGKRPMSPNQTRKKLWIEKHRIHCNSSCRYCSRYN